MVAVAWSIVIAVLLWTDEQSIAREGHKYNGYEVTGVCFLIAAAVLIIVTIAELRR